VKEGYPIATAFANALMDNKILQKFDFSENSLGPRGAEIIANLLKTNRSITDLGLAGDLTQLADSPRIAGMTHLSAALEANSTLTKLDLSRNFLDGQQVKLLAACLQNNKTLKNVNLSDNRELSQGAGFLAQMLMINTTLELLDLTNTEMDDLGKQALAEALGKNPTLKSLGDTFNDASDGKKPEGDVNYTHLMQQALANNRHEVLDKEVSRDTWLVTLKVIEGKDLIAADFGGKSDPYCLSWVHDDEKCKTKIIKKTCNPSWQQSFVFKIYDKLPEFLHFEVFDWDYIGADDTLGTASLSLEDLVKAKNRRFF